MNSIGSCITERRIAGDLSVRLVASEEFFTLEEPWNRLLTVSASNNVFLRHEWVSTWWEVFGSNRKLFVLAIEDNDELIGIVPLYLETRRIPTPARIIRFCGVEDLGTDHHDIIVEAGKEPLVVKAFFDFLSTSKNWDMVVLDGLPEHGVVFSSDAYRTTAWRTTVTLANVCPYVSLAGDYDAYLRGRFERKKRYNLERQFRLAFEQRGLQHHRVTQTAEVGNALDILFRLHTKRAVERNVRSTFCTPRAMDFHRRIAPKLHAAGFVDVRFLQTSNVSVSGAYSLNYANRLCLYQTGMDPEWSRDSVGTVLLTLLIKDCFSQGLSELDFLRGEEAYKLTWATGLRKEFTLSLYNTSVGGRLAYAASRVRNRAKSLLNSLRQRRTTLTGERVSDYAKI